MQPQRSHIVLSWAEGASSHSVWLDSRCTRCHGAGMVACGLWEEWQGDYEEACKQLGAGAAELDAPEVVPYPECDEEHPCPDCDGVGMVPTKQGRAVLELVRRYGS